MKFQRINSRVNMVRNQGMAYSSGTKPVCVRCSPSRGSTKAVNRPNTARYSWITAALSFRKKSCRYLAMNADRLAYASAARATENDSQSRTDGSRNHYRKHK